MQKNTAPRPDWESILSCAARLQTTLPDAVLGGGTASAIHAEHRFSRDADHVLGDLRHRFDQVLIQLQSVAGWKTDRVQRPVQILDSLDGIETGVRQLIREAPKIWVSNIIFLGVQYFHIFHPEAVQPERPFSNYDLRHGLRTVVQAVPKQSLLPVVNTSQGMNSCFKHLFEFCSFTFQYHKHQKYVKTGI